LITFEIYGRIYDVPEPKGAAAMELFSVVARAMEERGARAAMEQVNTLTGAERNGLAAQIALKLAGSKDGPLAVQRTLIGGKLDGEEITPKLYMASFSSPGRFSEPYVVAIMAWSKLGFFFDLDASKPAPNVDEEGADPSGSD